MTMTVGTEHGGLAAPWADALLFVALASPGQGMWVEGGCTDRWKSGSSGPQQVGGGARAAPQCLTQPAVPPGSRALALMGEVRVGGG